MDVSMYAAIDEQKFALVELLSEAEEGAERVRAAVADADNTSYGMRTAAGQLVGAALVRWDAAESEIIYIAVAAPLRGQGLGQRFIEWLIAEGQRRGAQAMLVGTSSTSRENIAFYQRCGFRMDHVRRDYFAYIQPPLIEDGIVLRDMIVLRYDLAQ